jgi:HlyD family secretion protein
MRAEQQKIYGAIGVDPQIAGACRMREMRAQGGGGPGGTQRNATSGQAQSNGAVADRTPRPGDQGTTPPAQLLVGDTERGQPGRNLRSGIVFVAKGKTYEPRFVMLGAANFDYTEVVSGLEEGEQVALLAALSLQAQRQQQNDRFRQNMGGGVPGMQQGGNVGGGNQGRPGGR